ncbi:hypothetical protein VTJ04DRAFT_10509 [Mycothermus thermophilus]|uniref:uncharacterized protein n=1 Tax=Humicola insolens TaxID=85995 RepID=UPI0037443D7A
MLNTPDENGFSPIDLALYYDREDIVRALIEKGAQLNAPDGHGCKALYKAIRKSKAQIAELLISNGADFLAPEDAPDAFTPLHLAAQYGLESVVKLLIDKSVNVNIWNSGTTGCSCTPLHLAVKNGHEQVVEILLENNADPNAMANLSQDPREMGLMPLHVAAEMGLTRVVQLLLDKGADPGATVSQRKGERAPLHLAALNLHAGTAKELLERRADPDAVVTAWGEPMTPIWCAMPRVLPAYRTVPAEVQKAKCAAMAKILIQAGARLDAPYYRGHTLSLWAQMHGTPELCWVLSKEERAPLSPFNQDPFKTPGAGSVSWVDWSEEDYRTDRTSPRLPNTQPSGPPSNPIRWAEVCNSPAFKPTVR